jgi:hypothetical protein
MPKEETFLVTYGLHSFVTHACPAGYSVFTIGTWAGRKMVRHAAGLIVDTYGQGAIIQTR